MNDREPHNINEMLKNLPAASQKNEDISIPKIIHVIWAGGTELMKPIGIQNVAQWARNNPEFEVWLWVDKTTTPSKDIMTYQKWFSKVGIENVYFDAGILSDPSVEKIKPDISMTINAAIRIRDINDQKINDEYIRYEIKKLQPNYGASSDLLRYKISLFVRWHLY